MSGPEHYIRLRSSARSDRGRVRQNNEDSVHLWAEDQHVLAVVADGMGGAVAGEEASRIAVETVQMLITTDDYRKPTDYSQVNGSDLASRLRDAVQQANRRIIERQVDLPELKGMGTTLTLAFARHNTVVLVHVGDSRAYIVDAAGSIRQVTNDHSFVQALIDAGHITIDEAETHPMKNVLYRALGQTDDVEIDVYRDIHIHTGDRMVLCSDGLTLHVSPEEIAETAMQSDDPNVISEALVQLANSRGGKDNVSVIVVTVEETEAETESTQATDLDTSATKPVATSSNSVKPFHMKPDFHKISRPIQGTLSRTQTAGTRNTFPPTANFGEGNDTLEPLQ